MHLFSMYDCNYREGIGQIYGIPPCRSFLWVSPHIIMRLPRGK